MLDIELPEVDLKKLRASDYIQFMLDGARNNLDDPNLDLRLDHWTLWYEGRICVCLATLAIHEMHFPGTLYTSQPWREEDGVPQYLRISSCLNGKNNDRYGLKLRNIRDGLNQFLVGNLRAMFMEMGCLTPRKPSLEGIVTGIHVSVDMRDYQHDVLVKTGRESWFKNLPRIIEVREELVNRGL